MKKLIIIASVTISVIIFALIFSLQETKTSQIKESQNQIENYDVDIFMPTKSSRPGCEETNLCFIPSVVEINAGESVTWQNQDAAFHSVTSGTYDTPDGLFDSGHLDPYQSFTLTFDNTGEYDYFCTLHPWMNGKVQVK